MCSFLGIPMLLYYLGKAYSVNEPAVEQGRGWCSGEGCKVAFRVAFGMSESALSAITWASFAWPIPDRQFPTGLKGKVQMQLLVFFLL